MYMFTEHVRISFAVILFSEKHCLTSILCIYLTKREHGTTEVLQQSLLAFFNIIIVSVVLHNGYMTWQCMEVYYYKILWALQAVYNVYLYGTCTNA